MTEDNRIAEIRAVLDEVIPQTNWGMTAREHVGLVAQQRVRRIRAILEARPPARKPCEYVVSHWAGQEGSECVALAEPGSDYCKRNDHEWTPENTRMGASGTPGRLRRFCRQCERDRNARRAIKQEGAQP